MDQVLSQELLDDGVAQAVDVHGIAGDEVGDFFTDDRRAIRISAAPGRFPFAAHDGAAAGRAGRGHGKDFFRAVPLFRERTDDFRDDFPRLLDDDSIADADVLFLDIVFVVERRPFYRRTGQVDGLEVRRRGQDAGPAEADGNAEDLGLGLFGREFIGNGPARDLDRIAQARLLGEGIDLDDHAVRGVSQFVAAVVPAVDEGDDVFDVRKLAVFRIDLEMEIAQILEQFFLALDVDAAVAAQGIGEEGQFTLGCNARVELAQGAGSGVAGIGKGFQFVVAALLVQGFK